MLLGMATKAPAAAKTPPAVAAAPTPAPSKFQSFKMERIHRSQLLSAEYNPRTLSDAQRRKLRKGLEVHGLASPITWNRKTGNVVGGHQRLAQLDSLEGTADYWLDVAVVNLTPVRERELNILLNNREAQGDFDVDSLATLMTELSDQKAIDLPALGFDRVDLEMAFDSATLSAMFGEAADTATKTDALVDASLPKIQPKPGLTEEQKAEIKAAKKASVEKGRAANQVDFYCHLVFNNDEECTRFLEVAAGKTDNRYINGIDFCEKFGIDLSAPEPPKQEES